MHEDLWITEHVAAHPIEAMYACLSIVSGGVCERFPHAVETLVAQPFSDESKRKVLWDNCARLYGFD